MFVGRLKAEDREIYRSNLERALEEALVASRRQLEQKNRECQAAMEISERMTKEVTYMRSLHSTMIEAQLAQVQLLNNKLQEEEDQENAMRRNANTAFGLCLCHCDLKRSCHSVDYQETEQTRS